jgi:DNA-binding protein WhiA
MVTKEVRNRANRISNCENANLDKTVNAAQKQLADIRYIQRTKTLDFLPEKLRVTAELRLNNPELSLADLAALGDPPIGKSGLNHRLAKISRIADELREKE